MKKAVGAPVIIIAIVAALGLVWLLWGRANAPETPMIQGNDIQKPSDLKPNPAELPPGGAPPGAPGGGKINLPPGKR